MDIKNTRLTVLLIILGVSSVLFAAGIPDPQWNPGYDHGAARKNTTYTKAEVDGILAEVMRTDGTNADSPVFPGPVTVTGQTTLGNASATSVQTTYLSVGASPGTPTYPSRLLGNLQLSGGNIYFSDGYDVRWGNSDIRLYGNSAAGCMGFYTNGAEKMRLQTGQLLIATTTAAIDSAVKLKLNGGMEISPGGFAVIGTSTSQAGYDLTVASGAYLANVVATGTLKIPLVAPADPQTGMIWFEP